jgi:hypothetical protein
MMLLLTDKRNQSLPVLLIEAWKAYLELFLELGMMHEIWHATVRESQLLVR